jgi:thiamine biosynthesis lipoprotein
MASLSRPVGAALVAGLLLVSRAGAQVLAREAWAMGTRVHVVVQARERSQAVRASEAVLREIERVDKVLSTWDAASELSAANRAAPGTWVALTPELASLLEEAEGWAHRTGRAFDPTVGALLDAWGLRGAGRTPGALELEAALASTGPHVLALGRGGAVRTGAGWIDSGAFGKGAALRSVARTLSFEGVERILVDLGGQVWAVAPVGAPWSVGVAHPRDRDRAVATLLLRDASAASSGTSERGAHIVDPRTGMPAPEWGSVTVVSRDPLEADILSTALYVMGPEAGLVWARAQGAAALFLSVEERGLRIRWTEEMERWLAERPDSANVLEPAPTEFHVEP